MYNDCNLKVNDIVKVTYERLNIDCYGVIVEELPNRAGENFKCFKIRIGDMLLEADTRHIYNPNDYDNIDLRNFGNIIEHESNKIKERLTNNIAVNNFEKKEEVIKLLTVLRKRCLD